MGGGEKIVITYNKCRETGRSGKLYREYKKTK